MQPILILFMEMEDFKADDQATRSDTQGAMDESTNVYKFQGRYRGRHEINLRPEVVPSPTRVLNCDKKSNHKNFIPYPEFSMMRLPERYRDYDLVQIVHIIALLTVKITVNCVSQARPLTEESGDPYPLCELRGREEAHFGTGRIGTVWLYQEKDERTCPCRECQRSDSPKKEWGLVRVITAVHVVYDKIEALRSECHFELNTMDDATQPILLEGVDMERADKNDDRCHLSCVTHDISLLERIKPKWSQYPILHKKLLAKYNEPSDRLVITVSHPHGCPKHVSIGEWTFRDETGNKSSEGHPYVKYNYTTPTCPGSSGATLYILGRKWQLWYNQVHSGYDSKNGFNYSGTGCD